MFSSRFFSVSERNRDFLKTKSHLAREQGLGDAHAVWNGDKNSWLCRLTSLGSNITRLTSCDEMHCGWCWSCRQWRRRLGAVGGQRTSAEADSAPLQLDDGRPPAERTTITRRHSLSSHWYYCYSFPFSSKWTMLVFKVFHRLYSLHPNRKGDVNIVLAALMCPGEHFPKHYFKQNGIDGEMGTTYPHHDSSSSTVRVCKRVSLWELCFVKVLMEICRIGYGGQKSLSKGTKKSN